MIALTSLALLAIVARARTFGNPVLGFDEQFYLLVGDRMLQGAVPFVDVFDRKPVGLFLIYAAVRLLGGDGFLQYKLVATCFVVLTGVGVFLLARHRANRFGALAAAATYVLWLNFMEGEGGQTPVFYDLPMIAAGAAVTTAAMRTGMTRAAGLVAMTAVGLAIQIKYSVALEGVYFGCVLLWLGSRDREPFARLVVSGMLWIAAAALPTLLAFAWYAADGHIHDFVFSNVTSALGQRRRPLGTEITGLAVIGAILLPLLVGVAIARPWRDRDVGRRILAGWFVVAIAAMLVYGRFDSPHYGIPLLVPACVLLAPVLDGTLRRRIGIVLALATTLAAGQAVLAVSERYKGGREAAMAVAAAAKPTGDCIYVYDGYPALYMLTGSCLPTKWSFPGHLATRDESTSAAIGVDPVQEVTRTLATRPVAIVDDYPRFAFGNLATRRIVDRALASDYRLVACISTGPERTRLVYRRDAPSAARPPKSCPHALLMRPKQDADAGRPTANAQNR
ncbi:glycosyltransferase family 39 protein [Sphingomonas sp. A2-49]|uniref:glycosyltransferase family 39 protein n=1 Tax=Sphingomonas sp. A2-49 TaxID=1391375 RepID=UPI0021D13A13|nr:glycosyltransferase family 39 protein [Sphingomonas sp. A2-49]MCU6453412.1 glycosyltransferase family 39 protein [Sphingomonas sp. A2-49]